jgi:exonuclease SbcD
LTYRFIHTADIHLDSPLKSLALRHPGLSELIGNATRQVFGRIIDLCLDEGVDALVIAGDLYDGSQTSMKTARFLVQQFTRLQAAGIAVYMIRGNHDAEARITRELVFPETVKVFGAKAEVVMVEKGALRIALHGISFAKPHAPESLLDRFKPAVTGAVNVGILHTSLVGPSGHDPYAPCTVYDLHATGFDYWALGHVHLRADHAGRATVVMPGNPQGRDIGEAGAKSVTLVTVADDGRLSVETRPTAIARFERLPVDLDGATDWREATGRVETAIRRARTAFDEEHLVLRPVLQGQTPLAWQILRDLDLLTEQAVAVSEALGTVWIDKVENGCTGGTALVSGALAELAQMVDTAALNPAVLAALEDEAARLLHVVPRELRDMLGTDPAAVTARNLTLLHAGAAEIMARLAGAEGAEP